MASLWQTLRSELQEVCDDFREKGAAGVFYEASLDVRDIVKDAGGALIGGAKALGDSMGNNQEGAFAEVAEMPAVHAELQVCLPSGGPRFWAEVVALDSISEPPRARVRSLDGKGTCFVVELVMPGARQVPSADDATDPATIATEAAEVDPAGAPDSAQAGIRTEDLKAAVGCVLTTMSNEARETVLEVREKGVASFAKDVALDVVDLAGAAAGTVTAYTAKGAHKASQVASTLLTAESPEVQDTDWYDEDGPPVEDKISDWYNDDEGSCDKGAMTPRGQDGNPLSSPTPPKTFSIASRRSVARAGGAPPTSDDETDISTDGEEEVVG